MGKFPPINVHCTNVSKNNESRVQLLAWINKTLQSNFKRFEELCNGAAYCQLLQMLYPGNIDLDKVHLSTNVEYENLSNFKILQRAFKNLKIRRDMPINELAKGRREESWEFLQWFKKFFDANYDGSHYDPIAARGGRPIGYGKSSLRAPCSSGDGIRSKPSTRKSTNSTPRMQQIRAVSSVSLSAGMQTATTKLIRQSAGMESVSNSSDNAILGRGGRPNNIGPSSLPRPSGSGYGLFSNSPTPTSPMYTPKTQLSCASSPLLQSAGMRTGSTYGLVRQNSGMESVSNSPDNAILGRVGRPNNIGPSSLQRPCGSRDGLLSNSPTPTSPMYTPKTQLSCASSPLLQSAGMRTGSTYGFKRQNSGMESVSNSSDNAILGRGGRPNNIGPSSLPRPSGSGYGLFSNSPTPTSPMYTPKTQLSRASSSLLQSARMRTGSTYGLVRQNSGMESLSNSPDNAILGRGGRPNNIGPSSLPRPSGSRDGLLSNSPTLTSPMYTPKTQLSRASSSLLQSAGMRTGSTYGFKRQNSGMESVSIKSVNQSSMSPCVQPTDKFTGTLKPTDNVPAVNMPPNFSNMDIDFFKSIGICILPGMTEDELSKLFEAKCVLMAHEFRVDRYKLNLAKEIATEFEEGVDGNIAKQVLGVIQETEKRFEDPSCDN